MTTQDRKDYNHYKRLVQQGRTEFIPAVKHFDPEFNPPEKSKPKPTPKKCGERNGNSKLNARSVRIIRRMHADGQPQSQIADIFGITRPTVSYIVNRKTWRHV